MLGLIFLAAALASSADSQLLGVQRLAPGQVLSDGRSGVRVDWYPPASAPALSGSSCAGGQASGILLLEGRWPPPAVAFAVKARLFTFYPDGAQLGAAAAFASDPGLDGWLGAVLRAVAGSLSCSATGLAAPRLLLSRGVLQQPYLATTSAASDTLVVPLSLNITSKLSLEGDDAVSSPLTQASLICSLANASLFVPFDATPSTVAAVVAGIGTGAAADVPLATSSIAVTLWSARWALPSSWSSLPSYATAASWPCSSLAPDRCDASAAWFSGAGAAAVPFDVARSVAGTGQPTVMTGQPVLLLKRSAAQGGSFPSGALTRGPGAPLLGLQVQLPTAATFASLGDWASNAGDRSIVAVRLPRSDLVCPLGSSSSSSGGSGDTSNSSSTGGSGSSGGTNGLRRTGSACPPQSTLLVAASPASLSSSSQLAAVCSAVATGNLSSAVAAGVAYRSGVAACPPFCALGQLPNDALALVPSASSPSSPVLIATAATAAAFDALHSAVAAGGIRGSAGELLPVPALSSAALSNAMPAAAGFVYARPCILPSDPAVLSALAVSGAPTLSALCANASTASSTVCFWGEPPDCVPCPLGGLCPGASSCIIASFAAGRFPFGAAAGFPLQLTLGRLFAPLDLFFPLIMLQAATGCCQHPGSTSLRSTRSRRRKRALRQRRRAVSAGMLPLAERCAARATKAPDAAAARNRFTRTAAPAASAGAALPPAHPLSPSSSLP